MAKNSVKKTLFFLISLPKNLVLVLIYCYQKTLSPDHGLVHYFYPDGYCRFYPTCSDYGYQTIQKNGLVIGLFKTVWRILRCNPWNPGGTDLP